MPLTCSTSTLIHFNLGFYYLKKHHNLLPFTLNPKCVLRFCVIFTSDERIENLIPFSKYIYVAFDKMNIPLNYASTKLETIKQFQRCDIFHELNKLSNNNGISFRKRVEYFKNKIGKT